MRGLALLEGQRGEFYPLEVLCRLACLWLVLCQNIDLPPKQKEGAAQARVQKMLRFIEAHYAEDLALEDLAGAALVSKSECARCFQVSLHTTPMRYLAEYRLARAAELLKTSAAPIGEIARHVGFGQLSHFGKCFKEKTGLSPGNTGKVAARSKKGRNIDVCPFKPGGWRRRVRENKQKASVFAKRFYLLAKVPAFTMTILQKAFKVYWICTLQATSSAMEISPFE